ncbi:hypothetical protein PO124_02300 [Bacillus licheniformis]|nr:hypothetical protein [Bacillus licheniformis]
MEESFIFAGGVFGGNGYHLMDKAVETLGESCRRPFYSGGSDCRRLPSGLK